MADRSAARRAGIAPVTHKADNGRMRCVIVVLGAMAAMVSYSHSLSAEPKTASSVGIDHVQLRAWVIYKPTGDKGREVTRTFLRFKEAAMPDADFLPAKPSDKVPDLEARFFSDVIGNSLVECYYSSLEAVGDLFVMAAAYCLQTHGIDGSGAGAIVEAAATCTLKPGEHGGGRTHFVIFNEKRVVASSNVTLGFDCKVLDSPGTLPTRQAAAPSAARVLPPTARPVAPQDSSTPERNAHDWWCFRNLDDTWGDCSNTQDMCNRWRAKTVMEHSAPCTGLDEQQCVDIAAGVQGVTACEQQDRASCFLKHFNLSNSDDLACAPSISLCKVRRANVMKHMTDDIKVKSDCQTH